MGQRGKDRMRGEMRRTVLFFVCCGLFYSSLVLVILVRYGEEREVGRKRKEKEGLVEMEGKREDRKVWKNGNQRKGGAKGMETAEKRMGDVNLSGVFCYLIRCSDVFCSLRFASGLFFFLLLRPVMGEKEGKWQEGRGMIG